MKMIPLIFCIIVLAGCAAKHPVKPYDIASALTDLQPDAEHGEMLKRLSNVMENQLPQIEYDSMDQRLLDFYTEPLQEEYTFYGRFSNLGFAYIIGTCRTKDNPLKDLQLGPTRQTHPIIDYNQDYAQLGNWIDDELFEPIYRFPGVQSLFMSNDGQTLYLGVNQPKNADLGILFHRIVNENESDYFDKLHQNGAQALPPIDGSFIQIRRLEHGKYYCEYLPISSEDFERITSDETSIMNEIIDKTALELYTNVNAWDAGEKRLDTMNQSILNKVNEHNLIEVRKLSEISGIKKIEFIQPYISTEAKVIEDINVAKGVEEIIQKSNFIDKQGCPYKDLLILTMADGSTIELQMAADSCDGFILGSYSCYTPGKVEWAKLKQYLEGL